MVVCFRVIAKGCGVTQATEEEEWARGLEGSHVRPHDGVEMSRSEGDKPQAWCGFSWRKTCRGMDASLISHASTSLQDHKDLEYPQSSCVKNMFPEQQGLEGGLLANA